MFALAVKIIITENSEFNESYGVIIIARVCERFHSSSQLPPMYNVTKIVRFFIINEERVLNFDSFENLTIRKSETLRELHAASMFSLSYTENHWKIFKYFSRK